MLMMHAPVPLYGMSRHSRVRCRHGRRQRGAGNAGQRQHLLQLRGRAVAGRRRALRRRLAARRQQEDFDAAVAHGS
jgi:hypothetical protein